MRTENSVLMQMARQTLQGNWGLAIGTFVVYMIASCIVAFIPFLGPLLSLIIGGPLILGLYIFFLEFSRGNDARMEQIFEGFKYFGTAFGAYLLMAIFTMLWTLLLIIPGIIAAISYSMTYYIIADDRGISALDAITKSKHMMNGYKGKYFCLMCRFIGWGILCLFTLGIGFLWLIPYIQVSSAKFYDDIKGGAEKVDETVSAA